MKPAVLWDKIRPLIDGGMTIEEAAKKIYDEIDPAPSYGVEALVKKYGRHLAKLRRNGQFLAHGNSLVTQEQEIMLMTAQLGFADERAAGGAALLAQNAKNAGVTWQSNPEKPKRTAAVRAGDWSRRKLRTWRRQGVIKNVTGKAVSKARSDVAQQLHDGQVFFEAVGRFFEAQGGVPHQCIFNADEFTCTLTDNDVAIFRRVHRADIDRAQMRGDARGHAKFSVLLFANAAGQVVCAVINLQGKQVEIDGQPPALD